MNTPLEHTQQSALYTMLQQYPIIAQVVPVMQQAGGRAVLVGGAVRDLLLGIPCKDIDIEVYGLALPVVESLLRSFGPVSMVGKSFGVLRMHGIDIDWSLPRSDSSGRKPDVMIDPCMSFEDAFGRRDLTINAMGIDLSTGVLIDPYHGQDDLHKKILRAPRADLFVQDPLRFFRVMQFVGRFEMHPNKELNQICAGMDLQNISVERIEDEFEKLFLKSTRPSLGLRWLRSVDRMQELLPELAATIGIQQEESYHPEGDVFEHTMQALDAAAQLDYQTHDERLIVMTAAVCHDFGKATTTRISPHGITSYGHDVEGAKICISFLKRITRKTMIWEAVPKLVRYHMQPFLLVKNGAKVSAYKRLARHLAPQTSMAMLAKLSIADARGRNPKGHEPLSCDVPEIATFLIHADNARITHKPEEPVLHGRDIMDRVVPGPAMGQLLKKAYEIQIEDGIKDKHELIKRIFNEPI